MSARLPTDQEVIALQRLPVGERCDADLDPCFLNRVRGYGYLDRNGCRKSSFERLHQRFRQDGIVLFLGAGVSNASGIPDWRGLIDAMLSEMGFSIGNAADLPERSLSRVLETKAAMSLLSQFDLVAHECAGDDRAAEFVGKLRRHLYGQPGFQPLRDLIQAVPEKPDEKRRHDWRELVDQLRGNATLAAVGDLLLAVGADGPTVNRLVHAVVTTNVDNLLQLYAMGRAGGRRLLTTVDRPSVADRPGTISVYHLHGWLDLREERDAPVVSPPLVFRESEYFDTIANPAAFANYTAQSLFQRRSVLFIGTSMEDLNVRRWLHSSFEERRRHHEAQLSGRYSEYHGAAAEAYAASIRHFWLKKEENWPEPIGSKIREFTADSMRHLGVEVVWYSDHSEIPDHLRALRDPG